MTHQTMHVEHVTVTVRELIQDYKKHPETNQVTAYGGKLNIRPAYQREFIYKPHQQEAVIQTILKGFPLNIMYWAKTGDDTWEVLDGQQRTLSICEYCGHTPNSIRSGTFSVKLPGHGTDKEDDAKNFCNLSDEDKEKILNYKLDIYQCDGSADEKLDWFPNKRGIFEYILSGEDKEHEKNLHIRAFTLSQKRSQYGKQNGKCAKCGKACRLEDMEADHITPWSEGGHTAPDNLQLLCKTCNRTKSAK